jgi:hypothetical protein
MTSHDWAKVQEAVQTLEAAGLVAKARNGSVLITGGSSFTPAEAPAYVGVYENGFMVSVERGAYIARWEGRTEGPYRGTQVKSHETLEEAIKTLIANVAKT